jgi:glycosyltransferase involved in cell wall biosynthesis
LKPAVLQLIDSFHQGGSELQAIQLTRLLSGSDSFSVHLASLNPDGPLRSSLADLNLPAIQSFPLTRFYDLNAVNQLRKLVSELRQRDISIIHTHDFYTNVFGMTAGMLARVPVRIASMRETAGMRSGAQRQAQLLAYSLASHVVANCEAVRQRLIDDGVPAEKITVLYNGLNLERLVPESTKAEILSQLSLPNSSGNRYVTIVANMRLEVKNYPMFLNAARRVSEQVPEANFLLAGEGELTEGLKLLAEELGIAHKTHFLGRCDRVAELLSISDICVLSSKAEGFSNSILEYMAAGKPVVATDVGGAREVIGEGTTGYLVKSGDDAEMADKIIHLLTNPVIADSMGQLGRQIVKDKFSTQAQLVNTESLYERLWERKSTR